MRQHQNQSAVHGPAVYAVQQLGCVVPMFIYCRYVGESGQRDLSLTSLAVFYSREQKTPLCLHSAIRRQQYNLIERW